MLFTEFTFIVVFLLVVIFLYYIIPFVTGRIFLLVAASMFFYANWEWRFVPLILGSILLNYVLAFIIDSGNRYRKLLLFVGIILSLAPLIYFKYAVFFAQTLDIKLTNGILFSGLLPLGISFYTFQQITYLIDVYKKNHRHETNIIKYSFFVTFFPQLIAGPIVHYSELVPQIGRRINDSKIFNLGIIYFVIGFLKKIVIADTLATYVDPIFKESLNATVGFDSALTGIFGYTFQLYFDFSGYSDMAIGLGILFGFFLPRNFESPYQSKSISEFWQRWHMTLSRFLRDYIYFPLGGSKAGELRRYLNLLFTMLIGGLWHGAGWTFIAWGGLHGVALCINHAYNRYFGRPVFFGWAVTFLFVSLAWVLFRAETFDSAFNVYSSLSESWNLEFNISKVWLVIGFVLIWLPNSHLLAPSIVKRSYFASEWIFNFVTRRLALYIVFSVVLTSFFVVGFYEKMYDIYLYRNLPMVREVNGISNNGDYRSSIFIQSVFLEMKKRLLLLVPLLQEVWEVFLLNMMMI